MAYKRGRRMRRRVGIRRRRRTFRRRTFRRARKLNNRRVVTYRGGRNMPMPNILNTIVPWTALFEQPAAGAQPFYKYTLNMNNLNDLGGTLSTTAPLFHDNIMTMFARWIVHGSKIRVNGVSLSDTTATGDCIFGVFPSISASQAANITNLESAMSAQGSRWSTLTRYGNGGPRNVGNYVKIKSLMGLHDLVDDPSFTGQSSAAPTSAPIWTIFLGSRDETSAATGSFVVQLKSYVTYYRRDNEDILAPA